MWNALSPLKTIIMSIAQGKTDSEVKNYLCGRFFLFEVDFFPNIFDAGKAGDDWV